MLCCRQKASINYKLSTRPRISSLRSGTTCGGNLTLFVNFPLGRIAMGIGVKSRLTNASDGNRTGARPREVLASFKARGLDFFNSKNQDDYFLNLGKIQYLKMTAKIIIPQKVSSFIFLRASNIRFTIRSAIIKIVIALTISLGIC